MDFWVLYTCPQLIVIGFVYTSNVGQKGAPYCRSPPICTSTRSIVPSRYCEICGELWKNVDKLMDRVMCTWIINGVLVFTIKQSIFRRMPWEEENQFVIFCYYFCAKGSGLWAVSSKQYIENNHQNYNIYLLYVCGVLFTRIWQQVKVWQ